MIPRHDEVRGIACAKLPTHPSGGRLRQLDILRAVAVIGVIIQHAPVRRSWLAGWTGVDLFFVLSGFLVSGVLFAEHKTHGSIHVGRFLIRRGFKIYPAFYCLIAARILISLTQGHHTAASHWLPEVLFVQNYLPGLWVHTWSLAVEEHFYLLLAIALVVMAKRRANDPFRAIPTLFGIVALILLAARIVTVVMFRPSPGQVLEPTHLRLDSLFCGVALSFVFHYRQTWIERWATHFRSRVAVLSAACLLPVLLSPITPLVLTIGLTSLYVGYAGVLLLALLSDGGPLSMPGSAWLSDGLAFVGRYSYSIYVWHIGVLDWIIVPLFRKSVRLWEVGFWPIGPLFLVASVVFGIAMAYLIETPALRLRDRWFPSRSADPVPLEPVATT
jgi:peptidoglycan/LPS O-acetylase OafA/YrhL